MNGVITGSGTLNKTGTGKLALNAANTFSGGMVVTQGTAVLANAAGFGSGLITLDGDANGATLQFGINGGTLINTLNVIGTNNFVAQNGNNYMTDMTGDGTLTLNGGAFTFSFTGDMTAFSGIIRVGTITNPRFFPSLGNPNPNFGTGSSNALFDLGNTTATAEQPQRRHHCLYGCTHRRVGHEFGRRYFRQQSHHLCHRWLQSRHDFRREKFLKSSPPAPGQHHQGRHRHLHADWSEHAHRCDAHQRRHASREQHHR